MSNLSIKEKLIALVLIPLICFLISGVFLAKEKFNNFNKHKITQNIIYFSQETSYLIHTLQKERGLSVAYLATSSYKYKDELKDQRKEVNTQIKTFLDFKKELFINKELKEKSFEIQKQLLFIEKFRNRFNYLQVNKFDIIGFYTNINNLLLDLINIISKEIKEESILKSFISFEQLLRAKDLIGIQRAIGSSFIQKDFFNEEVKILLSNTIYSQKVYLKNFYNYADNEISLRFKKLQEDNNFIILERIQNTMLNYKKEQVFLFLNLEQDFFPLMTYKINKINELNIYILNKIKKNILKLKNDAINKIYYFLMFMFITILILLLIERKISKDIYIYFKDTFININNLFKYINKESKEVKLTNSEINFNSEINSEIKGLNEKLFQSIDLLEKDSKLLTDAINTSELYKAALEKSNIIIRVSLDKKITYTNNLFNELSGYKKNELLGKPYTFLQEPTVKEEEINNMFAEVDKKGVWKGTLCNLSKENKLFYNISTIVPIKDKKGKTFEYMGIRQDITELINIHKEVEETQRNIIYKMGEIAETRSKETASHVKRVSLYSKDLALLYGLSKKEAEILFTASPMHDIGKLGIPDEILKKTGKLTEEEFEIMKTHSQLGYDILKDSNEVILKAAAIVALEHHERWDGNGYPNGLKGEDIHIYGRITAVADVFDALGSTRVYKKAWQDKDIFAYLLEQKGKHFDPRLINLFLSNINIFIETRDKYID